MSGGVLAWLSVWSEVQMICICSSWYHCHPIISCSSKIQNGLPFWCRLTQVVLEKRPLNGCSTCSSSSYVFHIGLCAPHRYNRSSRRRGCYYVLMAVVVSIIVRCRRSTMHVQQRCNPALLWARHWVDVPSRWGLHKYDDDSHVQRSTAHLPRNQLLHLRYVDLWQRRYAGLSRRRSCLFISVSLSLPPLQ